jgi:predicted ATPase
MSVDRIWVRGYRSLRKIELPLSWLTVVTGANGSGKSNLYRALGLMYRASQGGLARAIAEEGGMPSVLWAGPRVKTSKSEPVRMVLGFSCEGFSFEIQLGLPARAPEDRSPFLLDPEVKEELIWHGPQRKPSTTFLKRKNQVVEAFRGSVKNPDLFPFVEVCESALSQLEHPELYPEITLLKREAARWRFYHAFDSGPHSVLRQPQVTTYSPVVDHDGSNLASALLTIQTIGDKLRLQHAVATAFPGSQLTIAGQGTTQLTFGLQSPGMHRALLAPELSDGTLRFLALCAALLTPRPPALMIFNEPETSLHPDVLPALARLIVEASDQTQLWLTTHSRTLVDEIRRQRSAAVIELESIEGATQIADADPDPE